MKYSSLINEIKTGAFDSAFIKLYGQDCDIANVRERYMKAAKGFEETYGELMTPDTEISLFSVPGRSEISGNHTDHNFGKVIAASISLDIIAIAAKTDKPEIRVKSEGFPEDIVSLEDVETVDESNY